MTDIPSNLVAGRGRSARRSGVALLAAVALLMAACGSAHKAPARSPSPSATGSSRPTSTAGVTVTATSGAASPSPSPVAPRSPSPTSGAAGPPAAPPNPAPAGDPCRVAGQSPPGGTIAAAFPTALAFAPDGRLFWAERSGTVRVLQGGASKVFATVTTVTTESGGGYSERGLLGLAISPTFSQDRYVYAFYSNADRVHQTLVRWKDCGGTGTGATSLVTFPSGGDCCHKGGRLAFGPDGKLYVTLGEEHDSPAAQNTSDVRGKVLRYNADGTAPADNPFGPGNPVWAYGFRNPFGIAFSATGQLAVTNNGPTGDAGAPSTGYDTVLFDVKRGAGYQWPDCYGNSHPLATPTCPSNLQPPDYSSESGTLVPTGATFVDGAGPAGYAGHLVFCTFDAGGEVFSPGAGLSPGPANCKLDVKQGPDHALYYSDAGHIYRQG